MTQDQLKAAVQLRETLEDPHDRHLTYPPEKKCPKCGKAGGLGYCETCHGPKR